MSKIETNTIDTVSGTSTLTLGDTNATTLDFDTGITSVTNVPFGLNNTPAWSVYNNGSQTISNATATVIAFDSERFDTDNAFDSTTNYRFTVPTGKGGKYLISAGARFEDGAFGKYIRVGVNGSISNVIGNMNFGTSSYTADNQLTGIIELSAGDYIDIRANQHSGSNKNLQGLTDSWYRSFFMGCRIGA